MANNKEIIITREDLMNGKSYGKMTPDEINELQDIKPNVDLNSIHPEFIAVLRSYDQVNGSVFNGKTRQNIIKKLIFRSPDTKLTNYKLASAKLASAIAKSADVLERNRSKLYRTADNTLNIIDEKTADMFIKEKLIVKNAWIAWAAAGVATLLGLLWWHNHAPNSIRSISENGQQVIDMIDELVNSGSGVLDDVYSDSFVQSIKKIESDVVGIIGMANRLQSELERVELNSNFIQNVRNDRSLQENLISIRSHLNSFSYSIQPALKNMQNMIDNLGNNTFINEIIQSRSTLSGIEKNIDDLTNFGYGGLLEGLVGNRINALKQRLQGFENTCVEFVRNHTQALNVMNQQQKHFVANPHLVAPISTDTSMDTSTNNPLPMPGKNNQDKDSSENLPLPSNFGFGN
jgi:t-SNARE complex subunit (syntaxin)